EEELEAISEEYFDAIYLGNPERCPKIPVVNFTTRTGFPQYGYRGIRNIARLVKSALTNINRPRSKLFRQVLYGIDQHE
ncbi:MAG: nitrogenase associated protein, partial [Promethearchaeota archaeon]